LIFNREQHQAAKKDAMDLSTPMRASALDDRIIDAQFRGGVQTRLSGSALRLT
jgi:hypothetical protein